MYYFVLLSTVIILTRSSSKLSSINSSSSSSSRSSSSSSSSSNANNHNNNNNNNNKKKDNADKDTRPRKKQKVTNDVDASDLPFLSLAVPSKSKAYLNKIVKTPAPKAIQYFDEDLCRALGVKLAHLKDICKP